MAQPDKSEITYADTIESQSLAAHVAMCRMRYETLQKRVGRVEYGIYAAAGACIVVAAKVIGASPSVIGKVVDALIAAAR